MKYMTIRIASKLALITLIAQSAAYGNTPSLNNLRQSMASKPAEKSENPFGNRQCLNHAKCSYFYVENDFEDLLGMGVTNDTILKRMTSATSIKVNGIEIPAGDKRIIPIFNRHFTVSFSTLPGFISTVTSIASESSIWLKAALIKMATLPVNPFKFEFSYQCPYRGEEEECISNLLVGQQHIIDLIDQPGGFLHTLHKFAQNDIKWTDWFSIHVNLPPAVARS